MDKIYKFNAKIIKEPDHGGAYVEVPIDIKAEFGKSRLPVHATFDGEPYDGQIVKMGTPCHIIGVRKDIQKKIGKQPGDTIKVTFTPQTKDSVKADNVEYYINQYSGETKARMEKMRKIILNSNPNISEKISWGMPTFVLNGNLVHFAAYKNHIGFYPAPSGIDQLKKYSQDYQYSKGAVRFPHDKPLPYDLIEKIVAFRVKENLKLGK